MINTFPKFFSAVLFAMCSFLAVSANAVLPHGFDGKELPSLAPMLDDVTPAVVNIATEGRVKQRQSPLFSDPFSDIFLKFLTNPLSVKQAV